MRKKKQRIIFIDKYFGSEQLLREKMDKHILQDIQTRLEGFPEERVPDLIDYIESQLPPDKPKLDKQLKTLKQDYFPEAGP
jgi:hypothetical protein